MARVRYKDGEEFTLDIRLSNLNVTKGVLAIGATLEYDANSLDYVRMNGAGNWSTPTYNQNNGKLVIYRNGYAVTDETIFKVTFRAKDTSNGTAKVILRDIAVSDGDEESNISSSIKNINIVAPAPTQTPKPTKAPNPTKKPEPTQMQGEDQVTQVPTENLTPSPSQNINNQDKDDDKVDKKENINLTKKETNNTYNIAVYILIPISIVLIITIIILSCYLKIRKSKIKKIEEKK